MGLPPPVVGEETPLGEAYRLLLSGHQGLLVNRQGRALAYLTRTDLVAYLAGRD
jgi:predicted transcriptional regulator